MSDSEGPESAGEKIKEKKQTSRRQSKRRQSSRRQSRRQSQRRQSSRKSRSSQRSSRTSRKSKFVQGKTLTNAEDIQLALRASTGFLESPIDLCVDLIDTSEMMPLQWENYQSNPLFLKMTNTTNTVVLNALYPTLFVPTLKGGPLLSPYKFVQLHFHWGERNEIGSEHHVEGHAYPLEAHVVLYKADYGTFEIARSMEDGVIILVYMFQTHHHSEIHEFTKHLPKLKDPYSQIPLDTVSLESFLPSIVADYVLYFGYMATSCNHGILWLVSRTTMAVTEAEMEDFRKINATTGVPIGHNFRKIKPTLDRTIYFVNVAENTKRVLHDLPKTQGKSPTAKSKGRRESRRASKRTSKRSSKVTKRSSKVAKRSSKVSKRSSKVAKK